MRRGRYVVYKRASRSGEMAFLSIVRELSPRQISFFGNLVNNPTEVYILSLNNIFRFAVRTAQQYFN